MVRALLFDWHGVLDKRAYRHLFQHFAETSCSLHEQEDTEECIRQAAERYAELGDRLSANEIAPDEFWGICESDVGARKVEWGKEYILAVDKNEELWNLIPELRKYYKVVVLSDCAADKLEVIRRTVDMGTWFDRAYFSCEYRLNKRRQDFFNLPLKDFGVSAPDCILIDDRASNIERAKEWGFETHLYAGDNGFLISRV